MLVRELGYFDVFLFPFSFGRLVFSLLGRSIVCCFGLSSLSKSLKSSCICTIKMLYFSYVVKWGFLFGNLLW